MAPAQLADRPYLHAVYDDPEYVVRNIWRLYGGWWDGIPAHLQPAPHASVAREVTRLAGGVKTLVARARQLVSEGDVRLAGHLIDWAAAASEDREVHAARAEIYEHRAQLEKALMTRGIFSATARDSAVKS